jgi:hypothetical protein
MNELTLLTIITVFIFILIFIIHLYDKHLVKKINSYEKRLEEKGIFKRHFTKQKKS